MEELLVILKGMRGKKIIYNTGKDGKVSVN